MKRIKLIIGLMVLVVMTNLYVLLLVEAQEIEDLQLITNLSWSPDGEQIAFAYTENRRTDVWVVKPDGSDLRNLTEDVEVGAARPLWSPDGNHIAYVSNYTWDETSEDLPTVYLWVMDRDGENKVNLTSTLDGGSVNYFSWSPDSGYLTFDVIDLDFDAETISTEMWIMSVDGSEQYAITPDGDIAYYFPQWSPTGKQITLLSSADISLPPESEDNGIWIAEVDLSHSISIPRQLVSGVSFLGYAWSPDGETLAAAGFAGLGADILIIAIDDGSFENVTANLDGFNADPQWSPTGEAVVFRSTSGDESDIWRVDVGEGFGRVNLTEDHAGYSVSPTWSPDGEQIAFVSERDLVSNIWIMNADGTGLMQVTDY